MDYQRLGPFKVIKQINPVNYHLELPSTMQINPMFHMSLLELYNESYILKKTFLLSLPVEIDNEIEYEVEEILNSHIENRCLEYLINWQGYGIDEYTWELSSNVMNAFEKIKEFHQ